jgi:hypothetical protein
MFSKKKRTRKTLCAPPPKSAFCPRSFSSLGSTSTRKPRLGPTRSRPGNHPDRPGADRNLHGAHPEITRNSPGADPGPTRSLPGADPETIRSRPGAHQTVTLVTGNTYIYTKKHNVILCCKQYTDDKLKTPKVYFLIKEPQYRNLHPK